MSWNWPKTMGFVIALFLSTCRQSPSITEDTAGWLLIWHPFQGKEAVTLSTILDDYEELHPDVKIIREYISEPEMSGQFMRQSQAGLGPDLIISEYRYLSELIRAKTLRSLNDYDLDLSPYLPRSISQVMLDDQLYGLPFSLNTQVLCYNRQRIQKIPRQLTELFQDVQNGHRLGVTSSFLDTMWGQNIFATPAESADPYFKPNAWAAWLGWLRQATKEPNFILADNRQSLYEAFATGDLDYYLCKSIEIPDLKDQLGEQSLGVAQIPGGTNTASGPILFSKVMAFSRVTSEHNLQLGLQLAQFLTNAQQQTKLALETESLIPVNRNVKLNSRLSSIQAILYDQSKTAIAVPLGYLYLRGGSDVSSPERFYDLVIEGELTPQQAADQLVQEMEQLLQQEKARSPVQ